MRPHRTYDQNRFICLKIGIYYPFEIYMKPNVNIPVALNLLHLRLSCSAHLVLVLLSQSCTPYEYLASEVNLKLNLYLQEIYIYFFLDTLFVKIMRRSNVGTSEQRAGP